jgi:hypothetical protein
MNDKVHYGILVIVAYITYMITTMPNSPDGIVLSGVIGALCALAGVHYGQKRTIEKTRD